MTLSGLRALGAPDLPEGHFYRVRQGEFGLVVAEVRRRRRRFSSRLAKATVVPHFEETAEEAVARACHAAHLAALRRLDAAVFYAALRRLEGDHA